MSFSARIRRTRLFQLLKLVNEDRHAHGEDWLAPGFHAILVHRVGNWRRELPAPFRVPLGWLCRFGYLAVRNSYGIELPFGTTVGRRVRIAHQSGIVIHERAVLGDECIVRQNVTIGAVNDQRYGDAPVLGRNVELGAGAVVVGRVRIGDGARIGPNAVVTTNVPPGARVFVTPPRMLHQVPPSAEASVGVPVGDGLPDRGPRVPAVDALVPPVAMPAPADARLAR